MSTLTQQDLSTLVRDHAPDLGACKKKPWLVELTLSGCMHSKGYGYVEDLSPKTFGSEKPEIR